MSVGQLQRMNATLRAQVIAGLSPVVRRKLAHLAAIGAQKRAGEAAQYAQIAIELTGAETKETSA